MKKENQKPIKIDTLSIWNHSASDLREMALLLTEEGDPLRQYAAGVRLSKLGEFIKAQVKASALEHFDTAEPVVDNGTFSVRGGGLKYTQKSFEQFEPFQAALAELMAAKELVKAAEEKLNALKTKMKAAYEDKGSISFLVSDDFDWGEFDGTQVEPAIPETAAPSLVYTINK